jgi:hypothetical protein
MKRPRRWLEARQTLNGRTHWRLTDHAHKMLTYGCLILSAVFFTLSVTWAVFSCAVLDDCGVGQRQPAKPAADTDPAVRQWQRQQEQIEQFREQLRQQQQQEKQ